MEQYKSKIMAFGMSKKGLQRENNEDNYQMGVYYKKIFIEQDSHTMPHILADSCVDLSLQY